MIDDIKSKEFQDIPSYIEHILKNFNQIYKAGDSERIIQGEKAKGLTPLDLELEKDTINEYYTVFTIYPRRRANKNDTLILDTRPANISAEKYITTRHLFHCYGHARYLYHVFSHG